MYKFVAALYILPDVLPPLAGLSHAFNSALYSSKAIGTVLVIKYHTVTVTYVESTMSVPAVNQERTMSEPLFVVQCGTVWHCACSSLALNTIIALV